MTGRPAETGGAGAAIAVLLCHVFGVNDPSVLAALAVVVGFIPAAITWAVSVFRKPAQAAPPVK